MPFRIVLVIFSIMVALYFYGKSIEGSRKLSKIWLLGFLAWILPCITVLLFPYPNPGEGVTDIAQWQLSSFFGELFLRIISIIFCFLLAPIYYLSPLKNKIIQSD